MLTQAEMWEPAALLRVVRVRCLRLVRDAVDVEAERLELAAARALVVRVLVTVRQRPHLVAQGHCLVALQLDVRAHELAVVRTARRGCTDGEDLRSVPLVARVLDCVEPLHACLCVVAGDDAPIRC